MLKEADILQRPPGRRFGDDTADAIKAAHGRLNKDTRLDLGRSPLNPDGLVNPDGPTQAAARRLAGSVAETRRAALPKPAETLEQTARRFAAKRPVAAVPPAAKTTLPARVAELSGDDVQALERLAQGLRKTTHPGPVAEDIAGAFRAEPKRTAAEFAVIRERLSEIGTTEQVKNLDATVRGEMSAGEAKRFDTLLAEGEYGGRPPFTGPGGEGRKDETPDPRHQTEIGKFENELKGQGFTGAEARQRIDTFEKLTGPDATPDDKRTARVYRLGIDLDQARELAKLGDKEVDELVTTARESDLRGRALKRFFTEISGQIERISPTDTTDRPLPSGGGFR